MTFQVRRSEWKGTWYTHVSVERNYLDFLYLGTYRNGNVYSKRSVVTCPSARVIAWVLKYVEREDFDHLNKGAEIMHTGNCLRCGKELTDATSIEIGLGPVCRSL